MKEQAMTEIAKVEPLTDSSAEPGSVALMRLIERAATSPEFDVEKLQKLLDVKTQWEANEARKAFIAAKAAFKAEAPEILKNKHVNFPSKGGQTDYDHATLDNVADALASALSSHGLSYSWEADQNDAGAIRVTCVLTHVLGHSERVSLQADPDQSGGKNNIQAIGSTVTYLERYTLLAATGIATKDQDDDGARNSRDVITAEQKQQIIDKMKETGADTGKFLAYLNIPYIDELPASRFKDAMAALEKKRKKS